MMQTGKISFQGVRGAYSHQACAEAFPGLEGLPCSTFEAAIEAVKDGRADLAMLPVENSTYGRVADIHHLLPDSGLHIIREHFLRVHINLLGLPGTRIEDIRTAMSHTVLLGQCRAFLREHRVQPRVRRALDELAYFTTRLQILGVYPRDQFRDAQTPVPLEAEPHPA